MRRFSQCWIMRFHKKVLSRCLYLINQLYIFSTMHFKNGFQSCLVPIHMFISEQMPLALQICPCTFLLLSDCDLVLPHSFSGSTQFSEEPTVSQSSLSIILCVCVCVCACVCARARAMFSCKCLYFQTLVLLTVEYFLTFFLTFFFLKCAMLLVASPVLSFWLLFCHYAVFPLPQHPSAVHLKGQQKTVCTKTFPV